MKKRKRKYKTDKVLNKEIELDKGIKTIKEYKNFIIGLVIVTNILIALLSMMIGYILGNQDKKTTSSNENVSVIKDKEEGYDVVSFINDKVLNKNYYINKDNLKLYNKESSDEVSNDSLKDVVKEKYLKTNLINKDSISGNEELKNIIKNSKKYSITGKEDCISGKDYILYKEDTGDDVLKIDNSDGSLDSVNTSYFSKVSKDKKSNYELNSDKIKEDYNKEKADNFDSRYGIDLEDLNKIINNINNSTENIEIGNDSNFSIFMVDVINDSNKEEFLEELDKSGSELTVVKESSIYGHGLSTKENNNLFMWVKELNIN